MSTTIEFNSEKAAGESRDRSRHRMKGKPLFHARMTHPPNAVGEREVAGDRSTVSSPDSERERVESGGEPPDVFGMTKLVERVCLSSASGTAVGSERVEGDGSSAGRRGFLSNQNRITTFPYSTNHLVAS